MQRQDVTIPSDGVKLGGTLALADGAAEIVLFAHGSGSSRFSPRNRRVAGAIEQSGIGTLLFDLLSEREEAADLHSGHLRFDIELLSRRLVDATEWLVRQSLARSIGYFGASTGAAAALVAAAKLRDRVRAVVSRGGRPDLAGPALPDVRAPTLLIVGGRDEPVIALNEQAYRCLECTKELVIVPGATHLFEERGALDEVARLAVAWFSQHLHGPMRAGAPARPPDTSSP
jgi:dienelactone hydrolase